MDMRQMTLEVVGHYQDQRGVLGYRLLEAVERHLFPDDTLPWPLVLWGLTAHGHCLAWTQSSTQHDPIILLHPSLLAPAFDPTQNARTNPWGIQAAWCGVTMVLDVVIHELMHVAVNYCRGPWQGGESSHNNPLWIAEVNRLAPLLGWPDVVAAISKPVREKKKVVRRSPGSTIPFDATSRFPQAVRVFRGEADAYYTARHLPFPVDLPQRWRDRYTQPEPVPALPTTVSNNGQAHDEALPGATSNIETPALTYDPHKHRLGLPCKKHGHQSHGAAGNLRDLVKGDCLACRATQRAENAMRQGVHP